MEELDAPASLVEVSEPAILLRIDRLYRPGMSSESLYDVVRGVWRVGDRRNNAQLALGVCEGIVREVYVILGWHAAGTTPYHDREIGPEYAGRWEFSGFVAPDDLRGKYIGRSVAHYFKRGAQNPVQYVNC